MTTRSPPPMPANGTYCNKCSHGAHESSDASGRTRRPDPIELVAASRPTARQLERPQAAAGGRSSASYSSALSCLTCIMAHSSRQPAPLGLGAIFFALFVKLYRVVRVLVLSPHSSRSPTPPPGVSRASFSSAQTHNSTTKVRTQDEKKAVTVGTGGAASEPNRGRADGRRDGAPRPARPPAVDTPAHARQPGRSAALGAALAVAGLGRTHNSALAPASELLSRHGRGLGVHSQPAAVRRRRLCWRLLRGVARERTRTARARTWTWAWARRSMGSRHGSRQ